MYSVEILFVFKLPCALVENQSSHFKLLTHFGVFGIAINHYSISVKRNFQKFCIRRVLNRAECLFDLELRNKSYR